MELIRDLEQKFQNLDATLNSRAKVYAFYINYNNSYNRINTRIFNESKEKKYEIGLNARRDEMLDLLIQKRNEQLEQVNEFMQSSQQNDLTQLKTLADSAKSENLEFSRGLASVFESIMFRSKLANPFKFGQLVKYSKLLENEENVCLAKVNHLLRFRYIEDCLVHVLPSNLLLLFCSRKRNMVVLNKSGDLIRLKELQEEFTYAVQLNATNIIVHHTQGLNVYNFDLELIHSIRIRRFCDDLFKLNNYEIALSKKTYGDQLFIACYNYKTEKSNKKTICIKKNDFERILDLTKDETYWFELLNLNDRFLFIVNYVVSKIEVNTRYFLFILNRHDGNSLFKYFESGTESWLIYNNEFCSHPYNYDGHLILVFDLNSEGNDKSLTRVYDTQGKFNDIYSTSNYKFIYSRRYIHGHMNLAFNKY